MPHDSKGRLIQRGDTVKAPKISQGESKVVGVVKHIYPGADTCNLSLVYPDLGGLEHMIVTAKESEIILKADGTEPAAS